MTVIQPFPLRPGSNVWFSSDHHFGHENILRYAERPYASVGEMNFDMARRWNLVVGVDDLVYHLGDFAMGPPSEWAGFCRKLNGRIVLIRGNHDREADFMVNTVGFEDAVDDLIVTVDGVRLWLNHYPPAAADGSDADHRGRRGYVRPTAPGPYDVALCGPIHQHWRVREAVVNVGVDVWDFLPISLAAILAVRQEVTS